jgi:ribosomal protein S18
MKFTYRNKFNNTAVSRIIVDYKDPKLVDYVAENVNKLVPRRISQHMQLCLHTKLTKAVKRARYLALLPYCCSKHVQESSFENIQ